MNTKKACAPVCRDSPVKDTKWVTPLETLMTTVNNIDDSRRYTRVMPCSTVPCTRLQPATGRQARRRPAPLSREKNFLLDAVCNDGSAKQAKAFASQLADALSLLRTPADIARFLRLPVRLDGRGMQDPVHPDGQEAVWLCGDDATGAERGPNIKVHAYNAKCQATTIPTQLTFPEGFDASQPWKDLRQHLTEAAFYANGDALLGGPAINDKRNAMRFYLRTPQNCEYHAEVPLDFKEFAEQIVECYGSKPMVNRPSLARLLRFSQTVLECWDAMIDEGAARFWNGQYLWDLPEKVLQRIFTWGKFALQPALLRIHPWLTAAIMSTVRAATVRVDDVADAEAISRALPRLLPNLTVVHLVGDHGTVPFRELLAHVKLVGLPKLCRVVLDFGNNADDAPVSVDVTGINALLAGAPQSLSEISINQPLMYNEPLVVPPHIVLRQVSLYPYPHTTNQNIVDLAYQASQNELGCAEPLVVLLTDGRTQPKDPFSVDIKPRSLCIAFSYDTFLPRRRRDIYRAFKALKASLPESQRGTADAPAAEANASDASDSECDVPFRQERATSPTPAPPRRNLEREEAWVPTLDSDSDSDYSDDDEVYA